jgi:uncharacterized damage-inducible protein DinB
MISVEYGRAMSNYNRAMNARLYECCASLSDDQRKRDVGAFFQSIHGTLNHLLLGDRLWAGRFVGKPFSIHSLAQELYSDFTDLRAERERTDEVIVEWANGLTAADLASDLSYTTQDGRRRQVPLWFAITHFFNHETHHRGQVTALLSQFDVDPGVTDLITFPIGAGR